MIPSMSKMRSLTLQSESVLSFPSHPSLLLLSLSLFLSSTPLQRTLFPKSVALTVPLHLPLNGGRWASRSLHLQSLKGV